MTICNGLSYYLYVLIGFLLISVYFNLKQRYTLKSYKENESSLIKEAYFDSLTALPNRMNVDMVLKEQIHRCSRHKQSFMVSIIRISKYHDTHLRSEELADLLILESTKRLIDSVRNEDVVGRISENNFIIIFNEYLEKENLKLVLERIYNNFKDEFKINNKIVMDRIVVSIGVSKYPDNAVTEDNLINYATHEALKTTTT